MIFRNLKMAGFKSFAELAEINIESGLTGIVGPNGCGKSNIVEGLRWVMGESSARQMRSAEMDDVIFSGTELRPAHNLAEITLQLDNSDRRAPAEFNDCDHIEICRKIEREKGSSFYINGKPARARDVQLLFADTATGARASGIVSQGRIGALVDSKPTDRRTLIEEAANIRGLHARRHEAELKLRGAETNMERLNDIISGLNGQRDALKKQARQAARFRSVAERIRKAEAELLMTKWTNARKELSATSGALNNALLVVAERGKIAAKNAAERAKIAASLPTLRNAEIEKAAIYQRLALEREGLRKEKEQLQESITSIKSRQEQINNDINREKNLFEDAKLAGERLLKEIEDLTKKIDEAEPHQTAATSNLLAAEERVRRSEILLVKSSDEVRACQLNRTNLKSRAQDLKDRRDKSKNTLSQIDLIALEKTVNLSKSARDKANIENETSKILFHEAEKKLDEASSIAELSFEKKHASETEITRLQAEIDALRYLLSDDLNENERPVIDQLKVLEGMEAALSSVLADELSAPVGRGSTKFWRNNARAIDLGPPPGTKSLTNYISGGTVLKTALAGVGVIDDIENAEALQLKLLIGQALVTRKGDLWRWDGFVRKATKSDKVADRIRQRRRIAALELELKSATEKQSLIASESAETESKLNTCREKFQTCRIDVSNKEQKFSELSREFESDDLKLSISRERAHELGQILIGLDTELSKCEAEISSLPNMDVLVENENKAKEDAEHARSKLTAAIQTESRLADILQNAKNRKETCTEEEVQWQRRLEGVTNRIKELKERLENGKKEQDRLEIRPENIQALILEIGDKLEAADNARQKASDKLLIAEKKLEKADISQREADKGLTSAREEQIRAESTKEYCNTIIGEIENHIRDKFDCNPNEISSIAEITIHEKLSDIKVLEERLNRLLRERDNMGPVNLRADKEMEELAAKIKDMENEQADLGGAILKLREAISQLNREGRGRLLASFKEVDKHFKLLFKKLFGGGTAELRLTDSSDPLDAGLEIMASPPGKRLQSLSLLSGGEQALTALAMIFAVFQTNPAPICVLDEVDAPLDDSNVSRFCDLLQSICDQTQTRFLVVTHHRMTMARMDRLFGITMEKRGISKLVSVDLQTAEKIRDNLIA